MDDTVADDPIISPKVNAALDGWTAPMVSTEETDKAYIDYRKYLFRKWIFIFICIGVSILVTGYALTVGPYDIGFLESYQILFDHILGNEQNALLDYIITELRLPRIACGIIAGCGLAVAGAVMQSTLMNPLADPYTTGVSSGASFGATIAITSGITLFAGGYGLVFNAFIFSLIPSAIIVMVSKMKNASPTVMIMSGIAVMYIFNACTTVMMLWADPNDMKAVYEWQVGTLTNTDWSDIVVMLAVTVAGCVILQFLSQKINVLATGDDSAKALGVNANTLRTICLLVVALMSASIVCFTGLIGFVGLVAPHITRLFIGADNKYLLPASAAFGSALLILADLVGRTIIAPATLEVGVITAFVGGPVFLWLLVKKKSELWG